MPILTFAAMVLIVFGVMFVVCEQAQRYFYDDVVNGLWWRTLLLAVIVAGIAYYRPATIETIFTEQIFFTLGGILVTFFGFWLLLKFHPGHAAAVAVSLYLIMIPTISLGLIKATQTVIE